MPRFADRERLTEARVTEIVRRPHDKETHYWCDTTPGFGLRVRPTGGAAYVFRYSLHGKPQRETIGSAFAMSVAEARAKATTFRSDAGKAKHDASAAPVAQRKASKATLAAQAAAPTLADLVKAFLEARTELAESTLREYRRMLTGKALATLRTQRASEITRADLRALRESIAKHGTGSPKRPAPMMAKRLWTIIGASYRWAIDEEWGGITKDPTYTPRRSNKRPRSELTKPVKQSLTVEQYAAVGAALRQSLTDGLPVAPSLAKKKRGGLSKARKAKLTGRKRGAYKKRETPRLTKGNTVQVQSLMFLMLTGWRRGEVYGLRWRDLRERDAMAILLETKSGRSVRPLGTEAMALLQERKKAVENTPLAEPDALVFPMPGRSVKRPEPRHLWYAVRHAAGVTLRLHDLRHSFTTMMRSATGVGDEVVAAAVGHSMPGITAKYGDAPQARVRVAVNTTSTAVALALNGQIAKVLELTNPDAPALPATHLRLHA